MQQGHMESVGDPTHYAPSPGFSDASNADAHAAVTSQPFTFTGTGAEYFRIWIVNLALTLVTVGIYSAWAKVRTRRYFYGNTRVGDSSFDYLANPVVILKGRLISVAVFVAYSLVTTFQPLLSIALSIGLFVITPWLIVRSLSFRARNSAFRNIRFGFTGNTGDAGRVFVLYPLLTLITLGLLAPWASCRRQEFMVNHMRFGSTPFRLHATPLSFYTVYLRFVPYFALAILIFAILRAVSDLDSPSATSVFGIAAVLTVLLYGSIALSTGVSNLVYNATALGPQRLRSTLRTHEICALYLVNSITILLSFGILIPWARVRTARYRASRLTLEVAGGLDTFLAGSDVEVSALGDELSDMFEIDVGI